MDVFDLSAKINLNSSGYQKGLSDASKSFSDFGDKIKGEAATVAKVSAAAVGTAAAGVGALVKQSVAAYASYEQLTGGVEKLFGESSDLLMMYAKDAYKTVGLSTNEYMETVTSFAAALTTSVQAAGGSMDEAVELADTAMQSMADNANVFGTDMTSIQNAYQGFAKQNYTMLDNLKLGYGGTKAEMERLIEDANKLRHEQGINNDLTIESYADVITAIHTVQTEMKITGTTSKEAAHTVSGSMGSVKAAWKNLTVEMARDDGDVASAFNVLGETIGAMIENMLPRVEKAIGGVGDLITAAAPQVIKGTQKLLPRVLPSLVKTAGSLVTSVGSAAFQALTTVPDMIEAGRQWFAQLAYGLSDSTFDGGDILANLLDSVVSNAPYYLQYAEMLVSNLANQLLNADYKKIGSSVSSLFTAAVNSITDLTKDIDFYKVGEDIADFLNAVDWQEVTNSLFDLLAAGIKAAPDIAVSFFANADLGNLMTMIGLLGAPKLLGGITNFTGGEEGQALAAAAGSSWSGAFMSGIKAFGLGWAIGSYLRDNITIGDKTLGEWVETGAEKVFGEIPDEDAGEEMFTTIDGRKALMYDAQGNYTKAYKNDQKKRLEQQKAAWSNFDINEYRRQNGLPMFGDGGRVTRPTLAIVGEKEPETIVPDSKRGEFGNKTIIQKVEIIIQGAGKDSYEIAEEVSKQLADLSVRQQRALGGAGW